MLSDVNEKVVVVQRQTLDWGNISDARFKESSKSFCQLWGKPEDLVYRMKQLWDDTFGIGYFETRQAVKSIAESNIHSLRDIEYVPYCGYNNIPDEAAYYLFIDDDDWFSPDIAAVIRGIDRNQYDGILWHIGIIGSPKLDEAVLIWGMGGRCMTNNYALSSDWLDGLRRLPEVLQHAPAVKTFSQLDRKLQLDRVLSVTNKNPCSSVSLEKGLQGDFSKQRMFQLVKSYVEKMKRIQPEQLKQLAWAAPYIDETIAVFEKILMSRRV